MPLPASPVEICNMALGYLGQPAISSITSPVTQSEKVCALYYDISRKGMLRKYVWNFAKARALCSRTGTPAFDWPDEYQLPNDFVRLLSFDEDSEVLQSFDYDIEGRFLLANKSGAASVNVRYIKDIEDVTVWDAGFLLATARFLAFNMAYQITKKKDVVEQQNQMLALELQDVVAIDGQERPPLRIERSRYLSDRISVAGTTSVGRFLDFDV